MSRTPDHNPGLRPPFTSSAPSTSSIKGIDAIAPQVTQDTDERAALMDEERGGESYGATSSGKQGKHEV